jgi:hypothetical protein
MTQEIIAVLWIGADPKPTKRPDVFRDMKVKSEQFMNAWIKSTQGENLLPNQHPPQGISWQVLKDQSGKIQHVPFPTMLK